MKLTVMTADERFVSLDVEPNELVMFVFHPLDSDSRQAQMSPCLFDLEISGSKGLRNC